MKSPVYYVVILLLLSGIAQDACAQRDSILRRPFRHWTLSVSGTYLFDHTRYVYEISDSTYFYEEWIFTGSLSTDLSQRMSLGVQYRVFQANSELNGRSQFFMAGIFTRYHLGLYRRNRWYAEGSAQYSNYCLCNKFEGDPYKKNGLVYIGLGGGWNPYITRNLSLDLGFMRYYMLNRVKDKFSHAQYIVGLGYTIPGIRKR
ncbi:MAG TPA: hypothetical protein PKD70_12465 [Saprospiraceae bacterium]|nr:hypothetical protein [Saprospiraceae bacterium]HMP14687.1 hypothetical protein [Saprospiraceae bacterium]